MIIVTGASGFLGQAICAALRADGHELRTIGRGGADIAWPASGDFDANAVARIAEASAVIHLAGATIGVRWTAPQRRAILDSRVRLTAVLARALAKASPRPATWLSASAVGYYGDTGDTWVDESNGPGGGFLADTAFAWEGATQAARDAGVRVEPLRLGVVMGRGGMLAKLRLPFLLGAGGRLGSGRQWLSWIALADAVSIVRRCVADATITGAVNVVSPNPVTNAEFTAIFARALHRPAIVPVPGFALRAVYGEMAEQVLLAGQRVRPARLLALGYPFAFPDLAGAVAGSAATSVIAMPRIARRHEMARRPD